VGVVTDRGRWALGDDATVIQTEHGVAQRENQAHIVEAEDDGGTSLLEQG